VDGEVIRALDMLIKEVEDSDRKNAFCLSEITRVFLFNSSDAILFFCEIGDLQQENLLPRI